MFEAKLDVVCITTNAFVRKDGRLVMGRGAAYEATKRFPNCDRVFGSMVNSHLCAYGILIHPDRGSPILAAFQVKTHWADLADLTLIEKSVTVLDRLARRDWKHLKVGLNFPGIGNGGLKEVDVLPLLKRLPDNVSVWKLT